MWEPIFILNQQYENNMIRLKRLLETNSEDITSRINTRSIEFEDIDPQDHPDYTDAYISYAEFKDGTPLNDEQLEELDEDRYWVHDQLWAYLY